MDDVEQLMLKLKPVSIKKKKKNRWSSEILFLLKYGLKCYQELQTETIRSLQKENLTINVGSKLSDFFAGFF